jgi:predicted  nucleic acid-binding Zn-ribbon protein
VPPAKAGDKPGADTPPAAGSGKENPAPADKATVAVATATDSAAEKTNATGTGPDTERPPDHVIKELNPVKAQLKAELLALNKRLDEARVNMKDEHPTIISFRKQISDLQVRIDNEPDYVVREKIWDEVRQTAVSTVPGAPVVDTGRLRQLKSQLDTCEDNIRYATLEVERQDNEIVKLQARQASLAEVMNDIVVVRQKYTELTRAVSVATAEADQYQKNLASINASLAAETAKHGTHLNARTLAEEQFTPSSPKLSYILLFALLGGLTFGAGLVFLANVMDRSISTTEEAAEYFGMPVYGVVGEIVTPRQRTTRKIRRLILSPAAVLIVIAALGFATLNIVLWLQYRNLHEEWRKAPATFIAGQVEAAFTNLKSRL